MHVRTMLSLDQLVMPRRFELELPHRTRGGRTYAPKKVVHALHMHSSTNFALEPFEFRRVTYRSLARHTRRHDE